MVTVTNRLQGIAYRGLFIIDPQGILRQITVNDLPVGRYGSLTVDQELIDN